MRAAPRSAACYAGAGTTSCRPDVQPPPRLVLNARQFALDPRASCKCSAAAAPAGGSVLSLEEHDWRRPLCSRGELQGRQGLILALGKFDAMHRGHRALAEAATRLGGYPCLLSFWGMAEVLKLAPRKPLTAEADRPRVLRAWAPHCSGLTPMQRNIPFASIRHLSPQDFVRALAEDIGVMGVVAGENYRFGYKAAGDAKLLRQLGEAHGLKVEILALRGAQQAGLVGPASSTKVRECLQSGRVKRIISYLDRPYALMVPWGATRRAGGVGWSSGAAVPENGGAGGGDRATSGGGGDGAAGSPRQDARGGGGKDGAGDGAWSGETGESVSFNAVSCLNMCPCPGEYEVMAFGAADDAGVAAVLTVAGDVCELRPSGAGLDMLGGSNLRVELLNARRRS